MRGFFSCQRKIIYKIFEKKYTISYIYKIFFVTLIYKIVKTDSLSNHG